MIDLHRDCGLYMEMRNGVELQNNNNRDRVASSNSKKVNGVCICDPHHVRRIEFRSILVASFVRPIVHGRAVAAFFSSVLQTVDSLCAHHICTTLGTPWH